MISLSIHVAQASREMYSKTSTYTTEHDQVYSQTLKQKEEDRNAGSFYQCMRCF